MSKCNRNGFLVPNKFGTPNTPTSLEKAMSEFSKQFWSELVEVREDKEDGSIEEIGYLRLAHKSMAWSRESQTRQRWADNTTLEKLKLLECRFWWVEECLGKFMNAVRARPQQTVLFNGRLYRQMKISETIQGIPWQNAPSVTTKVFKAALCGLWLLLVKL